MSTRTIFAIACAAAMVFTASAPSLAQNAANTFGGPAYVGAADFPVVSDFIEAGGGAGSFSMIRAWNGMIGPDAMQAELTKLASTYGEPAKNEFVRMFDYTIADTWTRAGQDGIGMPGPTGNSGESLALSMLRAGRAPNGTFWTGYLFGHLMTPRVYSQVIADVNDKFGSDSNAQFHRMANQFFYDVGQRLGTTLGLAPTH